MVVNLISINADKAARACGVNERTAVVGGGDERGKPLALFHRLAVWCKVTKIFGQQLFSSIYSYFPACFVQKPVAKKERSMDNARTPKITAKLTGVGTSI